MSEPPPSTSTSDSPPPVPRPRRCLRLINTSVVQVTLQLVSRGLWGVLWHHQNVHPRYRITHICVCPIPILFGLHISYLVRR